MHNDEIFSKGFCNQYSFSILYLYSEYFPSKHFCCVSFLDTFCCNQNCIFAMKFFSLLFFLFCLLGLCYQSYLIISEYVKYDVSTTISLNQKSKYIPPSLSTCFKIYEIFDYKSFKSASFVFNDTNIESVYRTGIKSLKFLTIDDIFRYTPPVMEIVKWCEIRNASTFAYHEYGPTECYEKFDIEKYVIASLVCYKLTLKQVSIGTSASDYSKESTFFSPSDNGDIFYFILNQSAFLRYHKIVNVMHPIDNYPFYEFPLSQMRDRGYYKKNENNRINLFGSKSSTVTINKIPPPYVTMCQRYRTRYSKTMGRLYYCRDSQHCLLSCITEGIESQFDRASLTNHYFTGINLRMFTNEDFCKKSISAAYADILRECYNACPENDCQYVSTYTTTIGIQFEHSGIYVMLPDRPSFIIEYGKKVTFLDTFNFICGCVGVWFGFSFFDLNPFRMKAMKNHAGFTYYYNEQKIKNLERRIFKASEERSKMASRIRSLEIRFNQRLRMIQRCT